MVAKYSFPPASNTVTAVVKLYVAGSALSNAVVITFPSAGTFNAKSTRVVSIASPAVDLGMISF